MRAPALGLLALLLLCPAAGAFAEGRYQVELLVFRHTDTDTPPAEVAEVRAFRYAWELTEQGPPPHPAPAGEPGDTFQGAWRQLDRVGGYAPLLRLAWVQSRVDFHPWVRVHDDELIAEELYFPHDRAWADLQASDPLAAYRVPWYRLDGAVRLRHSRFLHLDLDLEYRVDNPDWALPPPLPTLDELTGAGSAARDDAPASGAPGGAPAEPEVSEGAEPEPFRVHRLRQSRQVRTGEVHYFDSPYLGVLARVTALDAE